MARCFGIFTSFQEQTSFLTLLCGKNRNLSLTLCVTARSAVVQRHPDVLYAKRSERRGKGGGRGGVWHQEGGRGRGKRGRRRGREGEAASADCQAVSKCQRRSLSESWTSRLETPNKQRLSHRVNVGGDKPQRRPPSCDFANQSAEACGGGDNPKRRPLVLLGEAAARLTATSEEKHFASEREGGRWWRGNVDKLPLCGAVWTQEDRVSSPADVLWR